MTSPKELFSLQELDLALDQIDSQTAEAEEEVSLGVALGGLEEALREESQGLEEFQSLMKTRGVEAETQRERSAHLDGQLYGGEVTSPSALESLEQEATNVRTQMEKLDLELTELSLRTEVLPSSKRPSGFASKAQSTISTSSLGKCVYWERGSRSP